MSQINPFNQTVTFHRADGTPFGVWLPQIDVYMQYCIRICINYASQLGASIILLVVLLLLTRPDKRSSAIFLLNCFALLFNTIRLVCQIVYFTSDFTELYRYFSQDFDGVAASAYATSIAGVVIMFFVLACALSSLVLQVQVVCSTFRRRYRRGLLIMSTLVALIPLGFRLGYVVQASRRIMDATNYISVQWLESTTNIAFTTTICFFCAIFVSKLGYAMIRRKRLGVRELGPMKAIFIMGCQTMFIPGKKSTSIPTKSEVNLPVSHLLGSPVHHHRPRTVNQRRHARHYLPAAFLHLGREDVGSCPQQKREWPQHEESAVFGKFRKGPPGVRRIVCGRHVEHLLFDAELEGERGFGDRLRHLRGARGLCPLPSDGYAVCYLVDDIQRLDDGIAGF